MEIAWLRARDGGNTILRCLVVFLLIGLQVIVNRQDQSSPTLLHSIRKNNNHDNTGRKTSSEIRSWIQDKNDTELNQDVIPDIPLTFPRPTREDTVRIYNASAWTELRRILTSDARFTICVNGGSVTAGGGTRAHSARYFRDFARYLEDAHVLSPNNANVTILDRGHGARGSLHSALVSQYYFPPDTIDILVWEFSINDAYHFDLEVELRMAAERKAFETWLRAVSEINPRRGRPPLVILVYLWSSPFQLVNDTTIVDHVFESHQNVAAMYDFVVGYVHVGRYVEEFQWGHETTKELLIADKHHPNRLGHAMIGFLLLDFCQPDVERLERALHSASSLLQRVQSLPRTDEICDREGWGPARIVSKLLKHSKMPLASWTMDSPLNSDRIYPGMLTTTPNATNSSKLLGKQVSYRSDRQRTLVLPCCNDRMLEFRLQRDAVLDVSALNLGMPTRERKRDVMVFLDDRDVSEHQHVVYRGPDYGGRNCLGWGLGNHRMYVPWFWVVLPEKMENVTSVGLCSTESENCGKADDGGSLCIGSLSVY